MLVVNNRATRYASERRVLDWLRDSPGRKPLTGVAIADVDVPDLETMSTQQVDVLVLTPHGVTVVEVKGPSEDLPRGVIQAEVNGPWTHSHSDIAPFRTRASDANPIEQARDAAFKLRKLTVRHNPQRPFVNAVVTISPHPDSGLGVRVGPMPTGCQVVLGATDLRAVFTTKHRQRASWTAEQAYSLISALNLKYLLTLDDLVAQGFPRLDATYQPPAPGQVNSGYRRQPRPYSRSATSRFDSRRSAHTHATPSAAALQPQRHRAPRHRHRGQQAIAIAVILAFVLSAWWLYSHYSTTPAPAPLPRQPAVSTQHGSPTVTTDLPTVP